MRLTVRGARLRARFARALCLAVLAGSPTPRACVRVYARVLVPPNLYIHTYIHGVAELLV